MEMVLMLLSICVPNVPARRISITFRKIDDSKIPYKFIPDPDLVNLSTLPLQRQQQPINLHLRQDQPPQNAQPSQKVEQAQKVQQGFTIKTFEKPINKAASLQEKVKQLPFPYRSSRPKPQKVFEKKPGIVVSVDRGKQPTRIQYKRPQAQQPPLAPPLPPPRSSYQLPQWLFPPPQQPTSSCIPIHRQI